MLVPRHLAGNTSLNRLHTVHHTAAHRRPVGVTSFKPKNHPPPVFLAVDERR
ncbi:hypothetical protein LZ30DRAFT_720790 [Colletotrichum cereale]|nr:hypothetical protein LZ30DRAFT_720790 [Colletotrichum cereale]